MALYEQSLELDKNTLREIGVTEINLQKRSKLIPPHPAGDKKTPRQQEMKGRQKATEKAKPKLKLRNPSSLDRMKDDDVTDLLEAHKKARTAVQIEDPKKYTDALESYSDRSSDATPVTLRQLKAEHPNLLVRHIPSLSRIPHVKATTEDIRRLILEFSYQGTVKAGEPIDIQASDVESEMIRLGIPLGQRSRALVHRVTIKEAQINCEFAMVSVALCSKTDHNIFNLDLRHITSVNNADLSNQREELAMFKDKERRTAYYQELSNNTKGHTPSLPMFGEAHVQKSHPDYRNILDATSVGIIKDNEKRGYVLVPKYHAAGVVVHNNTSTLGSEAGESEYPMWRHIWIDFNHLVVGLIEDYLTALSEKAKDEKTGKFTWDDDTLVLSIPQLKRVEGNTHAVEYDSVTQELIAWHFLHDEKNEKILLDEGTSEVRIKKDVLMDTLRKLSFMIDSQTEVTNIGAGDLYLRVSPLGPIKTEYASMFVQMELVFTPVPDYNAGTL